MVSYFFVFSLQNEYFFIKKSITIWMPIILWSESNVCSTWGVFLDHLDSIWKLVGLQVSTKFPPRWPRVVQVGSKLISISPNLVSDRPILSQVWPKLVPTWLQVPILEPQNTFWGASSTNFRNFWEDFQDRPQAFKI